MKKMVMMCLVLLLGVGTCMAAKPAAQKKTVTTLFKTDVDCQHCVTRIMNNVPVLGQGLTPAQAHIPTKQVTVVYDASKNDVETIVKGLASLKVKAEPLPGDEESAQKE